MSFINKTCYCCLIVGLVLLSAFDPVSSLENPVTTTRSLTNPGGITANVSTTAKDYGGGSPLGFTFLSSTKAVVVLKCSAPFPIHWVFDSMMIDGSTARDPSIFTERTFEDFAKNETYVYSSQLTLNYNSKIIKQNFTCQAVHDPKLHQVIDSRPMENGRKTQVRLVAVTEANPASEMSTDPTDLEDANLQNSTGSNCTVQFYYGLYQSNWTFCCESKSNMSQIVKYNSRDVMTLGSINRKSPVVSPECVKLVEHLPDSCPPITLEGNNHVLYNLSSMENLDSTQNFALSCESDAKELPITDPVLKVLVGLPQQNNQTSEIYFTWEDIKPENMIEIAIPAEATYFTNSTVSINCRFSLTYFAYGGHVAVLDATEGETHFKDDLTFENSDERYSSEHNAYNVNKTITLKNSTQSLMCVGPVWNSTEWTKKQFPVNVSDSKPLEFVNIRDNETVVWNFGDKNQTLKCDVTGLPITNVRWVSNNKTLKNESFNFQNVTEAELSLEFGEVDKSVEGVYECVVSNYAMTRKASLKLVVRYSSALTIAVSSCLASIIIIGLLAGGFFWWRKRSQQQGVRLLLSNDSGDLNDAPYRPLSEVNEVN